MRCGTHRLLHRRQESSAKDLPAGSVLLRHLREGAHDASQSVFAAALLCESYGHPLRLHSALHVHDSVSNAVPALWVVREVRGHGEIGHLWSLRSTSQKVRQPIVNGGECLQNRRNRPNCTSQFVENTDFCLSLVRCVNQDETVEKTFCSLTFHSHPASLPSILPPYNTTSCSLHNLFNRCTQRSYNRAFQ
jgi:hypothetical protein